LYETFKMKLTFKIFKDFYCIWTKKKKRLVYSVYRQRRRIVIQVWNNIFGWTVPLAHLTSHPEVKCTPLLRPENTQTHIMYTLATQHLALTDERSKKHSHNSLWISPLGVFKCVCVCVCVCVGHYVMECIKNTQK